MTQKKNIIPKKFYERELHTVAKELLGKILVRKIGTASVSGRIVEVEAYDGANDEASHSFKGRTMRNDVMFRGGGLLYVYFTYGMHFCANVVVGKEGDGKAVLIRALEPLDGIEQMARKRFGRKNISGKEFTNLANGPAKLCKALSIYKNDNGKSLVSDEIFIEEAEPVPDSEIIRTVRIGIKKSVDLQWRYYIKGNRFVSKK